MDKHHNNPKMYEVFAHVWLNEHKQNDPNIHTIADIPDQSLQKLQEYGFNWLWLMGVWQTGPNGISIARQHPHLIAEYKRILGHYHDEQVVGSPYAVCDYRVHDALGGPTALAKLRERLAKFDIRLMLDFVPNHLACDHEWANTHPEYFIAGDQALLNQEHAFYNQAQTHILCHGKDPYFDPWTDTAQLDWSNNATIQAMSKQLLDIAKQCDGVRCDMAMLLLHDIFSRTWNIPKTKQAPKEPWSIMIEAVRTNHPSFKFLAEAYWNTEERLLSLGFNWTYDKTLYDRLRHDDAQSIRAHLHQLKAIHKHYLHFIENHDEDRASTAFGHERQKAAITVCTSIPGFLLIHHKQMQGYSHKVPVQLGVFPLEPTNGSLEQYYHKLFQITTDPIFQGGNWQVHACKQAWKGNNTSDNFIAHSWSDADGLKVIIVTNYASNQGQCYIELTNTNIAHESLLLHDKLNAQIYARQRQALQNKGLYCDLGGYASHIFFVENE